MEEASVDIDYFAMPHKNDVGLARQALLMQLIPITQSMNDGADNHFRLCVATSDSRHIEATLGGRKNICHQTMMEGDAIFRNPNEGWELALAKQVFD